MKYIMAEISRGKLMELEEDKYTEKREKVYTFMKIPREFEKVRAHFSVRSFDTPSTFPTVLLFSSLHKKTLLNCNIGGLLFRRLSKIT